MPTAAVSRLWMRVKTWSTMPITSLSAGTKLPACASTGSRPTVRRKTDCEAGEVGRGA